MHILSVSSVFFYVVSVISECFNTRSGIAHGMCVESGRGCERSRAAWRGREMFGDMAPHGRTRHRRRLATSGRRGTMCGRVKTDRSHGRSDAGVRPDVRC
jgi:hypothetical protein